MHRRKRSPGLSLQCSGSKHLCFNILRHLCYFNRNLIEKPEEAEVKKENCISMVQCKVMKQLELLEQRKFEDEDIQEDISFLMEKMNESVQVIIAVVTFNISI